MTARIFYPLLAIALLAGCSQTTPAQPNETAQDTSEAAQDASEISQADVAAAHGTADLDALLTTLDDGTHPADEIQAKPIITSDGKAQIDWQYIDTSEPRADTANYDYPIALDSEAVANYAKAYNISPKAAQHSIVVGMAAPEALGKILDQLADGKYIGHTLTDGEKMSLVITTTADVVGETHEYVFADNFGKGLVLPIVIAPKDTP